MLPYSFRCSLALCGGRYRAKGNREPKFILIDPLSFPVTQGHDSLSKVMRSVRFIRCYLDEVYFIASALFLLRRRGLTFLEL